jgi:hypothetical protein
MKYDEDSYLVGKQLAHEYNWHTYEEWGGCRIYVDCDLADMFYVQHGGHSVYSSMNDPEWDEPYLADTEHVVSLIDEWEQIEKENEEYWNQSGGI